MAKTLIFNFDGTCNEPADGQDFASDESISNILKLHIMLGGDVKNSLHPALDLPEEETQHSFYYKGIGTYGGWFKRQLNAAWAPDRGDLKRILRTAIKDFQSIYSAGDRVLIFGFSRGAATARMFAAILSRGSENKIVRAGKGLNFKIDEDLPKETNIDFLGVFDTVSSFNAGYTQLNRKKRPKTRELFENNTMAKNIRHAVHLVSLDERRLAFRPTLFNRDDKRVLELWFSGVHSNIGGGYWHCGLSDIALNFMLEQLKMRLGDNIALIHPNNSSQNHNAQDGASIDHQALQGKGFTNITLDGLHIDASTTDEAGRQIRQKYFAKVTLEPRVCCVLENDRISACIPLVHRTVADRRANSSTGYRPVALCDKSYQICLKDDVKAEDIPYQGDSREDNSGNNSIDLKIQTGIRDL